MERHAPKTGDIIIRGEAGNPHRHYSVREFPGLPQVSYPSLEIALEIATRFGRSSGIDVWYEKDDGQFALLESTSQHILHESAFL